MCHDSHYFGQFSDFSESSAIIPTWSSQVKENIKVYDRYELKSLRTVVNHNPGIFKLNLSTVLRVRKLKLQRKSRKGHCGGMERIMLPSNCVNINNNISVAPINDSNLTKRVNFHHLGLINARSIKSKDQPLLNYALEHTFDAIIITETWLKDNDDIWKSTICLNRNGYHLLCSDRPEMKQGGGIGLMFRSNLKVKTLEEGWKNPFEYCVWQIRLEDKDQRDQTFEILAVYHPSPSEHVCSSFCLILYIYDTMV